MTTQLPVKDFYRDSITEIVQSIEREQVLRYLFIIVADVGLEQGVITEIPYSLDDDED